MATATLAINILASLYIGWLTLFGAIEAYSQTKSRWGIIYPVALLLAVCVLCS